MAEEVFNKAGDRTVYERLSLSEQDRARLAEISERQRIETERLRREQQARRDQDLAEARHEIVTRHSRPRLKPSWDRGRVPSKGKVEALACRSVQDWNQRELDQLNLRFEEEKHDIVSRAFSDCRETIEESRAQKKRDRFVTRYRSRSRDEGDRGR